MLKQLLDNYVLRNRYTLLITVLVGCILVIVIEGEITNREPQPYVFENPYFDLDIADPAPADSGGEAGDENSVSIRRLLQGR